MTPETPATQAARSRRAAGAVSSFDGERLALARRLARKPRTVLARDAGVTPAAISQFEKGQSRPTAPILAQFCIALGVTPGFFRHGGQTQHLPADRAHFRSLRATPAMARDQALAFAEISLEVLTLLEQYVDLPPVNLPALELLKELDAESIADAAARAREHFSLGLGPVGHVVKTLEAQGVLLLTLPADKVDSKVDAFSTDAGRRPIILLSPAKNDAARSRFDAAHELGHLLLHHDVEPGNKIVESEAHAFAANFLMPADEIRSWLPAKLDWEQLHEAKRYWGTSLKALVYRAKTLRVFSDPVYRRANQQLAMWGHPEPGSIGLREEPSLLGRVMDVLEGAGVDVEQLASAGQLTEDQIKTVVSAATSKRLRVTDL